MIRGPLTYTFTLLLFFIYGTVMCQTKDTIKTATYRIGKCRASVAGVRSGKISKRVFLNAKKLAVEWCEDSSKVSSFDMAVQYSTIGSYALAEKPIARDAKATNEYFTKEMISIIKDAPKGSTVLITQIKYRVAKGVEQVLDKDIEYIIQ
ncbi:MAG TPA: hypothetical protein VK890_10400 [Bacteroidia bacterium]|jgi:hypothetical protein|nr:hypothetical protein [Bacteroidia bacterium]